jgi:3-dehydroquinate synthase
MDIETLKTLPRREVRAGMAEMLKHGFIRDFEYLQWMDQEMKALRAIQTQPMIQAVRRNCEIKAEVVSIDERESGLRAILNYGHTVGHAIETVTHYRRYLHGEGVSLGMIAAAGISVRRGLISKELASYQRELLEKAGLPTRFDSSISIDDVMEAMKLDKKVVDGKVRFVLLTGPGQCQMFNDVTPDLVRETIMEELSC